MRKRVGGEFVKGLGELGDSLLVLTDVDLLEEGLVRQALGLVIGLPVHRGAVGQQLQSTGEVLLLAGVPLVVVLQLPVDVRQPCTNPILVPLERIEVDRVSEVRGQKLLALGLESLAGRGQLGQFLGARCQAFLEDCIDLPRQGLERVLADPDALVAGGDELLGNADGNSLASAGGALAGSTRAHEVGVPDALLVPGEIEVQPRLAARAVQDPLQGVLVLTEAHVGSRPNVEEALHAFPDLGLDDGWVVAIVDGAVVADLSDVIGVAQQLEEPRLTDRAGRSLRCGHGRQSPGGEVGENLLDRGVSGGVSGKGPLNQRGPFGVDLDSAVLMAVLGELADVEVAQWCASGGAAGGDLLGQALGDLGGEVLGVELRDRGHHPVHERAGGGLVDALGDRDQGETGFDQVPLDLEVDEAVAGEPVELVDDAVGDLVGLDVGEHPLQVGAVEGAPGVAGVDEFFDDSGAEVVSLALVGLPLCRD
nr:hypothetical protein [Naumannella halotolerans]